MSNCRDRADRAIVYRRLPNAWWRGSRQDDCRRPWAVSDLEGVARASGDAQPRFSEPRRLEDLAAISGADRMGGFATLIERDRGATSPVARDDLLEVTSAGLGADIAIGERAGHAHRPRRRGQHLHHADRPGF